MIVDMAHRFTYPFHQQFRSRSGVSRLAFAAVAACVLHGVGLLALMLVPAVAMVEPLSFAHGQQTMAVSVAVVRQQPTESADKEPSEAEPPEQPKPKARPESQMPTMEAAAKPRVSQPPTQAEVKPVMPSPVMATEALTPLSPSLSSEVSTESTIPVVTGAEYVGKRTPPTYPSRAIRLGQEGVVVLRALVTADGRTKELTLWQSSRYALLDRAALDAVWKWEFRPALRHGRPVTSWVEVPVSFVLKES